MAQPENTNSKQKSLLEIITCSSGTRQDVQNQLRFVAWCAGWGIFFLTSNWVLKSDYEFSAPVAWFIAFIPSVFGIGAVLAYMKFLRMADELMRKIQLEGLAVGFGVGLIFGLGYQVLEKAGAPHLEIDDLALVLMGGWMLGQVVATRRYR